MVVIFFDAPAEKKIVSRIGRDSYEFRSCFLFPVAGCQFRYRVPGLRFKVRDLDFGIWDLALGICAYRTAFFWLWVAGLTGW